MKKPDSPSVPIKFFSLCTVYSFFSPTLSFYFLLFRFPFPLSNMQMNDFQFWKPYLSHCQSFPFRLLYSLSISLCLCFYLFSTRSLSLSPTCRSMTFILILEILPLSLWNFSFLSPLVTLFLSLTNFLSPYPLSPILTFSLSLSTLSFAFPLCPNIQGSNFYNFRNPPSTIVNMVLSSSFTYFLSLPPLSAPYYFSLSPSLLVNLQDVDEWIIFYFGNIINQVWSINDKVRFIVARQWKKCIFC